MSSPGLLTEPEAAFKSKEVVQDIFTIGSDRKIHKVYTEPGYRELHQSPSTTDRKAAAKPKKGHGHKGRSLKKSKGGSGHAASHTSDRRANNEAIAAKDKSPEKADAVPADSGFQSSSDSKHLEAEKSPAVSSMQESVAQEASASQAAAPSEPKKETGAAQEYMKKLAVISDDTAPSSTYSGPFAQSCFPEAVVLKRHERNKNADGGIDSGRRSPAFTSMPTRPTQPLVCDPSPAPYDAAETSMGARPKISATTEGLDGPGKDFVVMGDAAPLSKAPTGSTSQTPLSPRTSSTSPTPARSGKLPAEAALLVPSEPLADTSESNVSAPWSGRIMKIIKHDSVPPDAEKKPAPEIPNVKSRYSGTADYQGKTAQQVLSIRYCR
ncbi:hypothetical protein V5799_003386 [Amblyomma americanum]|uniref:Uncharacterized protein n=1 Tax=Amblyomma americanum TaxID=6943 RepID=A0AAQ4D941_AMBAM